MPAVSDPASGLLLFDLSHPWGHGVPSYPGQKDVLMERAVKHSQHGVLAWRINTSMHTGTHMTAPIHLIQKGADLSAVPLECLFGNGVVLHIPKDKFGIITEDDLKAARDIKEGDHVVINTGWHHKYSDGLEYYGHAPGLSETAAQYLVDRKVKLVAMDTPFIDPPLATSMGHHRGGPQMKRLADEYREATGMEPKEKFVKWYPAQKKLLSANIPTVVQVGGDVDEISGKRATLAATPWRFEHGDACPVRMVAMLSSDGNLGIDSGREDV
jgi:kynurenine formamidase